jgi:hypothetical protein
LVSRTTNVTACSDRMAITSAPACGIRKQKDQHDVNVKCLPTPIAWQSPSHASLPATELHALPCTSTVIWFQRSPEL